MKNLLAATLALGGAVSTLAVPITPTADAFGPLPIANFGGSGIPNSDVATSFAFDGPNSIMLGLTAHQRYSNPALTSDGAGTFTATAGANYGDPLNPAGPGPSSFLGATWNFGFYANLSGLQSANNPYTVTLLVDVDPAADTDESAHLSFNIPLSFGSEYQDSQNLLFFPGSGFNPNVSGEYTFALIAKSGGNELNRAAIKVNVTGGSQNVPDAGSTAMLLGIGMTSLAGLRSLRKRS